MRIARPLFSLSGAGEWKLFFLTEVIPATGGHGLSYARSRFMHEKGLDCMFLTPKEVGEHTQSTPAGWRLISDGGGRWRRSGCGFITERVKPDVGKRHLFYDSCSMLSKCFAEACNRLSAKAAPGAWGAPDQLVGLQMEVTSQHLPILVARDQRDLRDVKAGLEQAAGGFVAQIVKP